MITLDTVDKTLEVILGGAITTNQLDVVANYRHEGGTFPPHRHSVETVTNGATAVIVITAPTVNQKRILETLSIYNADTVAATVTVRLDDDGIYYKLVKFAIDPGFTISYTEDAGWQVLSGAGALRVVEALASPLPIASGGTAGATVADALVALELRKNAITRLATVTGINAKTVANTTLYTVPAALTAVITGVVIRTTAFTVGAKAIQAVASVGANVTFDDYLNTVTYTIAANGVAIHDTLLDTASPVYAAAAVIKLAIETGSDATTETWAVDLFGYLF